MSNEYNDWHYDILTALNAKMWEADFLPEGWTNTFIPEMKKELADVLGSYVDDFIVFQIKEKWNELRCYWSWADRCYTYEESEDIKQISNDIECIIDKYTTISYHTCVLCGMVVNEWVECGYFAPLCDGCFKIINK